MPITLDKIEELNKNLEKRFRDKLIVNHDLKRTLVSFQANKKTPGYRWYKFKEGYSSALVDYTLDKLGIDSGKVLDPFAGSGTSLFASAERGLDAVGVELLPIGAEIMEVRKIIFESNNHDKLTKFLLELIKRIINKRRGVFFFEFIPTIAGRFFICLKTYQRSF